MPFILTYYLFGPFLWRATGCLIPQAEPQESVSAGKNARLAYQELEVWDIGSERHNTDWGGDGEASGTWMPMVILQGNCFKNVSRKVPSSAKLFLSGGELTNHKTLY